MIGEPAAASETEVTRSGPGPSGEAGLSGAAAAPAWSAVVINYNGADCVLDTIASLMALDRPPAEVILADDGSTDGSCELVRAAWPAVRIESLGRNTRCTSKVRNAGLALARERYVLVTDNDITFLPDTVERLQAALQELPDAAAATPLVCYADRPEEICNAGHRLHFLCWSEASRPSGDRPVPAFGCGIQMIDRDRVAGLGGFDEMLAIGWGDDGEFHYRLRIAGLACYSVPAAKVLHRRERATARYYGQLRNRMIMIAKCYQMRTLLLLWPALLLFEMLLVAYMAANGQVREYFRALRDVWGLRRDILAERRRVQAMRRCPDHQILTAGSLALSRRVRRGARSLRPQALATGLLAFYWGFCSHILRMDMGL